MSEVVGEAMVWFEHRWRVHKEQMCKKEFDEVIKGPKFLTIKNGLRYHWELELHPKGAKTEKYPSADKQPDMTLTLWIRPGGIQGAVEAGLKMAIVGGDESSSGESEVFNTQCNTEPSKGKYKRWFHIYPHQKLNEVGTATEVEFRVQIGIREQDFDLNHLFPDPPLHEYAKGLALYKETVLQEQSYVGRRDEGNAVLIAAGGERIQCHRLMLMESSPVFQRMFASECQESETGEVAIPDVSATTLKQLLYFCYVEALPDGWEDGLLLLAAAHKYDIKSLELLCEKEVVAQLSLQTAVKSLKTAMRLGLRLLEMKATHFILDNWAELSQKEKKELKKDDAFLSVIDVSSVEKAVEIMPEDE